MPNFQTLACELAPGDVIDNGELLKVYAVEAKEGRFCTVIEVAFTGDDGRMQRESLPADSVVWIRR